VTAGGRAIVLKWAPRGRDPRSASGRLTEDPVRRRLRTRWTLPELVAESSAARPTTWRMSTASRIREVCATRRRTAHGAVAGRRPIELRHGVEAMPTLDLPRSERSSNDS
jgi:hypothetical protein